MSDLLAREDLFTNGQQNETNSREAYLLMNGVKHSVFAMKYDAWDGTIHTASYYPQILSVAITLGGNALPIELPFTKWLAGEPLYLTKLKGKLDTKVGFANEA